MNTSKVATSLSVSSIAGWIFGLLLLVVAILNMWLVHAVPGVIYLILAMAYLPPTYNWWSAKVGLRIPMVIKILLAMIISWGTLAVSDLAEMLGL